MGFKQYLKESHFLTEGGAFGHLNNVYDNKQFTFADLKKLITDSLQGKLEYAKLKTDGQNLMFSWIDGELRMARNKGHLKNFGENSMTAEAMANKFKGRGGLEYAYNNAVKDLSNAISKLSDKQRDKIFKNGKKFMSVEVMHVDSENVVHYGSNQLRFHGTREYDESGEAIGEDKKDADVLSGMIKQQDQSKQDTYTISNLQNANLPVVPDFKGQQSKFHGGLSKLQSKHKIKDNESLGKYIEAHFLGLMKKIGVEDDKQLLNRLAHGDKSYKIPMIKKTYEGEQLKKVLELDKVSGQEYKNATIPFENLFQQLGATVLSNIKDFMVLNPDKTIRKMKDDLESAVKKISASKDPKVMKKFKMEMERFEKAGGYDALFPEEGITFIWNGEFMKYTGTFASANQLLGMLWTL